MCGGGRYLDAGVGPDAHLCPQGLAQRGCSQDVLGRESRREGRRRGGKEGGREGSWEEMHDSWAAVEPSRRAGKGAACSAMGGCETLRLKQAVDTPASSGYGHTGLLRTAPFSGEGRITQAGSFLCHCLPARA